MAQEPVYYRGVRPSHLPRASQSYGQGRVCQIPGCNTKVSMYNPFDRCWQHVSLYLSVKGTPRRRARRGYPRS